MNRDSNILPMPPGVIIKEQLRNRGMKQKEFAVRMGMSEKHISKLINGEVLLTLETANRLEVVLGVSAQSWCNLEAAYRDKLLKKEEEQEIEENQTKKISIMQEIEIAERMPYQRMAEKGWILDTTENARKIVYLRKYFEVVELGFLKDTLLPKIVGRELSEKDQYDCELLAWMQKAKMVARNVKVRNINVRKLEKKIPYIKEVLERKFEDVKPILVELLNECGVVLLFLPSISEKLPQEVTFRDGKKIIMLWDENMIDAGEFQRTLFHEMNHIICGNI